MTAGMMLCAATLALLVAVVVAVVVAIGQLDRRLEQLERLRHLDADRVWP